MPHTSRCWCFEAEFTETAFSLLAKQDLVPLHTNRSTLTALPLSFIEMELLKCQCVDQLHQLSAQHGREGTLLVLTGSSSWGWSSQVNCACNWECCAFTKRSYCLFLCCLPGKAVLHAWGIFLIVVHLYEMLNWSPLDSVFIPLNWQKVVRLQENIWSHSPHSIHLISKLLKKNPISY